MNSINKAQNRRDFLKHSALLGALISLNPLSLSAARPVKIGKWPRLGEKLTPVAILMDSSRLIALDPQISYLTKIGLGNFHNLAACGNTLEKGKKYLPEILENLKKGTPSDAMVQKKLAVVAGWLIYREIPPVLTAVYPENDDEERAISCMYRDAAILDEFAPNQLPAQVSTPEETADLLGQMWHRASSRMHTLTPDKENAQNWIIMISDWYQNDREDIHRLSEALHDAGSGKWEKYVVQPNFYGELDPLITLARRARKNRSTEFSINQFQAESGQSLYSQALWNGIKAVRQLDDYLTGQQSSSDLMTKLGIEVD